MRLRLKREVRQRIVPRLGDVEFGAVSAELDFVNAFMETVSNDFVYDEIFIIVSKKRGRKIV